MVGEAGSGQRIWLPVLLSCVAECPAGDAVSSGSADWCDGGGSPRTSSIAATCSSGFDSKALAMPSTELEGPVGFLAYTYPKKNEALALGRYNECNEVARLFEPGDIWIMMLFPRRGAGTSEISGECRRAEDAGEERPLPSPRKLCSAVMEELSARGAIRGNIVGFELVADLERSEGSTSSVHFMRRSPSSRLAPICSSTCLPGEVGADGESSATHGAASVLVTQALAFGTCPSRIVERSNIYAAKTFVSEKDKDLALIETMFLAGIPPHPNIVRFAGLYHSQALTPVPSWILVTDAHGGGDVHMKIQSDGAFEEHDAFKIGEGLMRALVHIHAAGVIHRDVKSANVVLAAHNRAVLIDFGLAVHVSDRARRRARCGTPGSCSPETLRKSHCGAKSDVFGAGTVLYHMIGGLMPFHGETMNEQLRNNAAAVVIFPQREFGHVSVKSKELIRRCLEERQQRRPLSSRALDLIDDAMSCLRTLRTQGVLADALPLPTTTREDFSQASESQAFGSDFSSFECPHTFVEDATVGTVADASVIDAPFAYDSQASETSSGRRRFRFSVSRPLRFTTFLTRRSRGGTPSADELSDCVTPTTPRIDSYCCTSSTSDEMQEPPRAAPSLRALLSCKRPWANLMQKRSSDERCNGTRTSIRASVDWTSDSESFPSFNRQSSMSLTRFVSTIAKRYHDDSSFDDTRD
eukprot:TRINITY_DN31446_c0_g1_i1.p1 TRINITY_DN31446_c0_g1~~TRINITY_DN31446_c0_g1_i1.p1  ORF type:complete len:801 (+),score=72.91 TRINITY_DN31446_c0_g1_i1:316-2403(+)